MMAGLSPRYYSIKAFSETDLTEDLKAVDVPTLIIHGDDEQIVTIRLGPVGVQDHQQRAAHRL